MRQVLFQSVKMARVFYFQLLICGYFEMKLQKQSFQIQITLARNAIKSFTLVNQRCLKSRLRSRRNPTPTFQNFRHRLVFFKKKRYLKKILTRAGFV